jgi:hypothetical protein
MSEKVRSACFVLTEGQHTKYHMLGLGNIPRLLTEGQHTIAVQSGAYPSSGQLCFLSLKVFRLESLRTEKTPSTIQVARFAEKRNKTLPKTLSECSNRQ